LLKFFFDISKFISAELHILTAQLAIPHNYNNFHAQTRSTAGPKEKKCTHRIPNRANKKKKKNVARKDILRLKPHKRLCSQNTGDLQLTAFSIFYCAWMNIPENCVN
jgi:hypothetical protein